MAVVSRILISLLIVFQKVDVECLTVQGRLVKKLFENYSMKARPVINVAASVQLKFGIALKQILDLDERNQIITTNVWIRQYWKDEFLKWNESEYGNINTIRVEPSQIWTPDLRLINIAQEKFKGIDIESKTKAIVYSTGQVVWLSPHILKSVCKMDVTYFPFDDQYCKMHFAPWAYNGGQVNITNRSDRGDLSSYSASGEFKLMSFNAKRVVHKHACCPELYPELIYTIHLRRMGRFYLMNTIIPSTLISFLAFLSFGLPPDSGERISLVITTLLSLAVFMTITSDQIPQTSEVFPLLQKFLTAVMLQIGIALVANCVVISWASRGQPPSEFTRKLFSFEYLKCILRCYQRKTKISAEDPARINTENNDKPKRADARMKNNENKMQNNGRSLQERDSKKVEINHWEKVILKNLEIIANATMLKKKQQINAEEWKLAAATLDRLCVIQLNNYDNKSRPVHNESTIVQLQFRLALKQILDVDERNQILITNVWLTQYWNDEFLRWDKSEYGNLSSITVDSSLLWKPDLRLYNIGQEKYKGIDVESKTKAIVYSDGRVVWPSPHILKSVCKMDVTYFPFDDQYCQMIFAPWAYHGGQVNITNQSDGGDLSSYSPSGEFKVISLNVKRVVNEYACCPEPYPELIYTIHLRRKARFYLMNTIIPSTLISFLAFLSFGLPPDSGERISLVITTLLSLAVFMTITSEQIPQTSEVFPLLQKFLTAVMLQIGIALVANCVVISWASRGQPPSEFTRKLLSFEYFKTMLRCHHRKAKISADNPARRITGIL
eukprot:gene5370-6041_t